MSRLKNALSTKLLTPSLMTRHQQDAITRLYECDRTFLIAKMGSGKTIICLSAIEELLQKAYINRVLIIAPKKVCESVWMDEIKRWSHVQHLTATLATGKPKDRVKAVTERSDLLIINYENVIWFLDTFPGLAGCDGLILDELSKLKASGGAVFKKLRYRIKDFGWRVGLTGTPVSEDYVGLYGQMLMIDGGAALGTSKERYLRAYFYAEDFNGYKWALRVNAAEQIAERINDTVYVLPDYRDELPAIEYWDEVIDLPSNAQRMYNAMKKDLLLSFEDGSQITSANAAVLTAKLQQIANGFVYDTDTRETVNVHNAKIDMLKQIVSESNGPVLIAYWYEEDRKRIAKLFGCPVVLTPDVINKWNKGCLNVLAMHPKSAGHGLNLANGGSTLIWYGPVWSRDLHEQTIARLWRKGQKNRVRVHTLVAANTVDEVIIERLITKSKFDKLLMEHLNV